MAREIGTKIVDRFLVKDKHGYIKEVVETYSGHYFINKSGKAFELITTTEFNKMRSDVFE